MTTTAFRLASAALGACLTLGAFTVPVFAIGDDSSTTPTCKKGEIYDQKTKKCVKQQGANITDENRADYAYSLAKKDHRYEEALAVLNTLQNPDTAEALNYRGYVTRKLGRTDEGISYYKKSVAMDPKYTLVREYLGEAYVIQGKFDLAKEQLSEIEKRCGTTCEPYEDLAEAIEAGI